MFEKSLGRAAPKVPKIVVVMQQLKWQKVFWCETDRSVCETRKSLVRALREVRGIRTICCRCGLCVRVGMSERSKGYRYRVENLKRRGVSKCENAGCGWWGCFRGDCLARKFYTYQNKKCGSVVVEDSLRARYNCHSLSIRIQTSLCESFRCCATQIREIVVRNRLLGESMQTVVAPPRSNSSKIITSVLVRSRSI